MNPTPFQKKVWFNALTAFCIVLIGAILVGLIWLSGEVLAYLQPVLVPLAVAGIFAYLLDPIVNFLQKKGLGRMKAIIVVFIVSTLGIIGFSWMIAAPLGNQIKKLNENKGVYLEKGKKMIDDISQMDSVISVLPESVQGFLKKEDQVAPLEPSEVEEYSSEVVSDPTSSVPPETGEVNWGKEIELSEGPDLKELFNEEMTKQQGIEYAPEAVGESGEKSFNINDYFEMESLLGIIGDAAPNLIRKAVEAITRGTSKIFGIIGYALGFILVPIYLFFFLKEKDKILTNWKKFVPLRASKFKDEVVDVLTEINSYLIAFFRGQVLVSIIDGVLVGVALKICGHPFAILLGIALAVLGVIPFIGNIICLVPAAVTAYAHFSIAENQYWLGDSPWAYVGLVVAIFIILQQINSLVTAPKIVGDSVGLHPMTVIFSMLFWSLVLGGFLGALLAVPLTAAVKVLFSRYIWQRKVMAEGSMEDEEVQAELA